MSANLARRDLAGFQQRLELKVAVLLGLIICLAFGLRLFHLGHQELRGDEAFDALFASQAVDVILGQLQTEQPYPPLFHVGLHFWLDLAGRNEVAQRLPALVSGVLLVPLVYQLARVTLGQMTGLIAAALVAINPFYIWHSQDGRMYSLLALFSVASIWLGLRLLRDRSTWKSGLAYWVATVLALLIHYFAWLVLLAENVAAILIIWTEGQRRARLGRWLAWQAAIFLALAAWLAFAVGLLASHTSTWIPAFPPLEILQRALTTFSLGSTLAPTVGLAFSLVMGALFVTGCLFPSQPVQPRFRMSGRGLLLVFVGVPLLATMLLSLQRPAFDEKYLIAVAASYLILVAHGLHFLGTKGKLVGIAAAAVVLLATGWSLANYYFNPEYAKSPSWRALVGSIEARAAEGDVIIHTYPDPGLSYYYDGDLPLRLLPAAATTPQERTERALRNLAASHDRIWLIPGPAGAWDTEGFVGRWLARNGELVEDEEIGNLRLQLYRTPAAFQEQMQAVDVEFGEPIKLLGYRLAPGAQQGAGPGQPLLLTLYWQALAPVDGNYTVFAHLSDSNEKLWGQHDGQPVGGTYPTAEWLPDRVVVDQHTIDIDPETPAGLYRLLVGMYDSSTGERLAPIDGAGVVDEDRIVLTTVEIAAPAE